MIDRALSQSLCEPLFPSIADGGGSEAVEGRWGYPRGGMRGTDSLPPQPVLQEALQGTRLSSPSGLHESLSASWPYTSQLAPSAVAPYDTHVRPQKQSAQELKHTGAPRLFQTCAPFVHRVFVQ